MFLFLLFKSLIFDPMLIGEYSHTIDDKGRLSLPAKFREQLKEGVVVTRGLDKCLFVYSKQAWRELADKISTLPLTSKQSRAFARLMLAGAWDANLDSQGRVMLPEYLRKYAQVKKQVVVAGLYNRLEIWDEDAWSGYSKEAEANSEAIAETLTDLGI